MAHLICKSSSHRTAILLWLFVSFAGQILVFPRLISAAAPTSQAQETTPATRAGASQTVSPPQVNVESSQIPLSGKQKREYMKGNFEKMKRDSRELADLANSLQEELNKSNENILSLDIVGKAEKIEKLARRIKGTARGF